jgi:hypothetical protein
MFIGRDHFKCVFGIGGVAGRDPTLEDVRPVGLFDLSTCSIDSLILLVHAL